MGLGRRRKSARDHLACVTVSLECLSLFQASQILESGRKIDDSLPASSPIWASEASRARTSERRSREGPRRYREARFACPNRRACSQAKLTRKNKNKNKTKQNWGETRARPSFPLFSSSFSPRMIRLAPHHLNSAVYYLNAWESGTG